MKKYCDWWLLPLLACLLAGCGDDDYHYPSVKLEFLTAFSGADGYLRSVVTDEGETLPVVEDKTKTVSYTHLCQAEAVSGYPFTFHHGLTQDAQGYQLAGNEGIPGRKDGFLEGTAGELGAGEDAA